MAKITTEASGTVTHLPRFAHSVDNCQLLTPRYARCPAGLNPWSEKAPRPAIYPDLDVVRHIVFDFFEATSTAQVSPGPRPAAAFIAACKAASGVALRHHLASRRGGVLKE